MTRPAITQVVEKIEVGIARNGPSCDNENYAVVTLTLAEALVLLAALAPSTPLEPEKKE